MGLVGYLLEYSNVVVIGRTHLYNLLTFKTGCFCNYVSTSWSGAVAGRADRLLTTVCRGYMKNEGIRKPL